MAKFASLGILVSLTHILGFDYFSIFFQYIHLPSFVFLITYSWKNLGSFTQRVSTLGSIECSLQSTNYTISSNHVLLFDQVHAV